MNAYNQGPIDATELYHTRMVILMETEPGSNTYQQLALTEEQFEEFQVFVDQCAILGPCLTNPEPHPHIRMRQEEHKLPDDIQDFYEED